jgi:hypothetical protein
MKTKSTRYLGLGLFLLGVLIALACAGIIVWGDMEATLFDPAISPQGTLNTLKCPVMMTAVETATVSVSFDNPLDRTLYVGIRAHFSQGYVTLIREERDTFSLEPGERQRLEWTVGPEDAAFKNIVLVRIHAQTNGPVRYSSGSCGIVVVRLPFLTGSLLFGLLAAVSLVCMGGGMALWVLSQQPWGRQGVDITRAMGTVAAILVAANIVGLLGMWLIALIILLFTVLLGGIMIGFVLTSR